MPPSPIGIFPILRIEIVIRNVHSPDDGHALGSAFIEDVDFRVIVLFEVFEEKQRA